VYSWYSTSPAGGYSLTGLAPGDYRIWFNDNNNMIYLPEWYNDVLLASEATTLAVTQGSATYGIDATLVQGSSIEGTVTSSGGAGIGTVHVEAKYWDPLISDWVVAGSDQTDPSGFYRVTGIRPGTYHVRFIDQSGVYVEEWYDDERLESEATSITVAEGVPTTGVSAVMAEAGHITGRVTSDGSTGIGGIVIDVYQVVGPAYRIYGGSVGTLPDGTFDVGGLVNGSYYLRFSDETGTYVDEYWNDVGSMAQATAIPVSEGATTSGIEVVMEPLVGDAYEDDDVVVDATPTSVDAAGQDHTLHEDGDHDWLAFRARGGHEYLIETYETWANCDTYLDVYAADGTTLLASNAETGVGQFAGLTYTPSTDGTYTVDVHGQYVYTLGCYGVRIQDLTDVTAPVTSTSDDGSWHDGAVDVSIAATDGPDGAGVSAIYARTDDTPPSVIAGDLYDGLPITFADEGISPLRYLSRDLAGNVEFAHADEIRIDLTDPQTAGVADSEWGTDPVPVTLSAEDPVSGSGDATPSASGVGAVYYRVGGGSTQQYAGAFLVSLEGETTVEYWSVDRAGNEEDHATALTRRDTTPPVLSDDHTATYGGTARITLSAVDAGCGCAAVDWSLDGVPGQNAGSSAVVECDVLGEHTLTYFASDMLGNTSQPATIEFDVQREGQAEYVAVAGETRYTTAIEASQRAFPDGAECVVIATGRNWPDALGGSPLAGIAGGPLLLTDTAQLPAAVRDEIGRLKPKSAYVLGGTGAVSSAVEQEIRTLLGGGAVTRLAGENRYGTAMAIADEVIRLNGDAYDGTCFVATGLNYPDALAASPVAAARWWPIVLEPAAGQMYWPTGATDAVVLGGTGAVSSSVENSLASLLGGAGVTRIGGVNRYDTAARVAEFGAASGMTWDGVGIATGGAFPDALSGGAMQGALGSVMLLTPGTRLDAYASAVLSAHASHIGTVYFIGGTGAVSQAVRDEVATVLGR